jgi:hypothetical protein
MSGSAFFKLNPSNGTLSPKADEREEVPLNWSKWIRQTHRWLGLVFTLTVIANLVALVVEKTQPPVWVTYSPLFPLAALMFTGLYMFVRPYTVEWRHGGHTDVRGAVS